MALARLVILGALFSIASSAEVYMVTEESSSLPGIKLPCDFYVDSLSTASCSSFNKESEIHGCHVGNSINSNARMVKRRKLQQSEGTSVQANLRHRDSSLPGHLKSPKQLIIQALQRDTARVISFNNRIRNRTSITAVTTSSSSNASTTSSSVAPISSPTTSSSSSSVSADWEIQSTVESGASLGSGEYLMDVYLGTPPRHFSLIIDTGSDLTWVQCHPCNDCFVQQGPIFDPRNSSSYEPISCSSQQCAFSSSCQESQQQCSYFYSYGDNSNTTGDLSYETMTLSLENEEGNKSKAIQVSNVVIGCGHVNKGLFHGAGGLLGLGQGPLAFTSQLKSSIYGHRFSYCLVPRDSDPSVTSTISFGNNVAVTSHPDVQFTSFIKHPKAVDTFYYLGIKSVSIGGENIPLNASVFQIDKDGNGGTIIDSGTTLTYLTQTAYDAVIAALESKLKFPRISPQIQPLDHCYNLSGAANPEFPEFSITFVDDAVLRLPKSNYLIQLYPEQHVECLAIAPALGLSIIGNFQQQNIHFLYDTHNSRLGFAPMDCASISNMNPKMFRR